MWSRRLARRIRALFHRADLDRDLAEEFRFHIEQEAADLASLHDLSAEEARRRALVAFGGVEQWRETHQDARGTRWLEDSWRDVILAVRSLRRNRGFAFAVVLTLALGIGANTAMFTLLRGTLLKPLPNRDGDRLVYLRQSAEGSGKENVLFSVPEVSDYRAGSGTLAELAEFSSMTFTLVADDQPTRVRAGIVSGNYFDVMGLAPIAGRLLRRSDDGPAAEPVTVLSHAFWMRHFGGDPGIVGTTIRVNGKASLVAGVLEPAPLYPERSDVFVNMVTSPHHLSATMVTDRVHRMTEVFARLAPGATLEQARDEIARLSSSVMRDHAAAYPAGSRFTIAMSPLRSAVNERASLTFWLLMGAAGFVLLIACANVANLTLMRGVGRAREMAVRAALGAGRWRLRRLLLVENLTLALVGGVLGVGVAFAALKLLVGFAAQFTPRANEIRIDGVVLAMGLLTSVVAAIALSFVSRLNGAGAPATPFGASRRTTLGRRGLRFQRTLVVAQIAVCMVLLTGAGLLVRTLDKLQAVEDGVRAERVLTVQLPHDGPMEEMLFKQGEKQALYEQVRARVAAIPGVDIVALGSQVPLRQTIVDFDVKAENVVVPADKVIPHAMYKTVDVSYFTAAGIPLVAGRNFESTDRAGSARVVVLSESFARTLFGDVNPIGRRIAWTGPIMKFTPFSQEYRTVVGIVGDTRDEGLDGGPTATVYMPFAQEPVLFGSLVIRTKEAPELLQPAVMRAIREVAPTQLIVGVQTLEQIRDQAVAPRRLNAAFVASFGGLALVIAMVGIAGVLAFSVRSRTAEIGIRMSFGADAARVRRMVLGQGGALLAAGVVIGLAGALATARLLSGLLFGIGPHDPATFGVVALVLIAVGLAACWMPAARAARVDPAIALRAE